ncbi:putative heavy metal-associated isoprenylated plant protein/8/17/18/19 [Dioscorea sansibarensis]
MGEEEKGKKEEEKPKAEEEKKKKDEGEAKPAAAAEEAAAAAPPPPPPPPEEIVMRVFMHCEGCARKVRRCLKGFDGVEEVKTDCRSCKVVVKGKKAAEDPLKVVERVQKKSGRKVELLSPLPPPKVEKKEEEKNVEEEKPKIEEKKEEPVVISVVLKVHMHCEACSQEIKKRILKMKGVQTVEADLKSSQVTVKGVFTAPGLVEYVHKRTGKHAAVVKQEPAEKKPEPAPETEPKTDAKTDTTPPADSKDKPEAAAGEAVAAEKKKDEANDDAGAPKEKDSGGEGAAAAEEAKVVEMKKYEYLYYQRYHPMEYAYPPQIFSDENPNACAVM